jgi:3-phenylpropionate/trans-cinnamate dioxygenase alpha subunit
MLNTCAHRGNAVCRAEEGNAKSFLCTYHGWSYGIDGRLKGVPGFKNFYEGELDKSEHPLPPIAQVARYKGFVFGTHDPTAPPLGEYLGAAGRLGMDMLACRGDMVAVPGVQKFTLDCNWKFAVDNLFDWYHPQVTHASSMRPDVLGMGGGRPTTANEAIDMSGVEMQEGESLDVPISEISGTKFDQVVVIGEYGHAIGGPRRELDPDSTDPRDMWRLRPEAQEALGPVGLTVAGHPSIFPTVWVTGTGQISLRIPRGPMTTEIWWFSFVDRTLPAEFQDAVIQMQTRVFGPAGLLEQDDGENWGQATRQTVGYASRQNKHMLNMGVGRGKIIREQGLARIETLTNEHGQLWTYYAWSQWMKGLGWDDLRVVTTPPDFI